MAGLPKPVLGNKPIGDLTLEQLGKVIRRIVQQELANR
jgi:hypothetical protein